MKPLPSSTPPGENPYLSLASASQTHSPLYTDEIIEATGRRAVAICHADRCAVFLRQGEGPYTCAWSTGLSLPYLQQVQAELSQVTGKDYFFGSRSGPLMITDTRKVMATSALAALSREEGYRSLHVWPVESRMGVIAAIGCYYNKPHTPTKAEYKAMSTMLRQASSALETALPAPEPHPAAVLNGLYDLSHQLVNAGSVETLLDRFVRSALEIAQVSSCRVLTRERDGAFICQAACPQHNPGSSSQPEPQLAQAVYQRIVRADGPWMLRRNDVTLTNEARVALGLDAAHSLCMIPLQVDSEAVGLLVLGEERLNESFHLEKVRLAAMIADMIATVLQRERLYRRLEDSYLETILALTRSLEARDSYTAGHSQRQVELIEKTGRRLGCVPSRVQAMRWAALLHDIGKIGIPDEILSRSGPLSAEEWAVMKKHPQIGADILRPISSLAHVAPFVLAHHERFDGTGYPYGLSGEEIPLEARILAVVDAYCAMTDGRVYRAAKTHVEALAELKRCAGTQFDPLVVEVFLNVVEKE